MNIEFQEKISQHILDLMEKFRELNGEESKEFKALYNQYVRTENEKTHIDGRNLKHYEAGLVNDDIPSNVERLYRRQLVVELTMVCAAHCRYCLRSNYDKKQISRKEIDKIVKYCSTDSALKEILITGGDPMLVPQLLKYFINELSEKAKNIEIIRIGTRLPVQDPKRFDRELFSFFNSYADRFMFEVAVQINHVAEIDDETRIIFRELIKSRVRIYSQNVLLKGVNDNLEALIDLYDELRYLGIEAHYLFHAVPIKGTDHFRCSLKKSLELIVALTSSGMVSGRIKPMLSLMTDIGKVTLYEGVLQKKDDQGYYLVKTKYSLEDRIKWNPGYLMPSSAFVDKDGYLTVKYLDGN